MEADIKPTVILDQIVNHAKLEDFKSVDTILVARDFTECPIGRYKDDGNYSGEALREMLLAKLMPVIDTEYGVVVDFTGVMGAGSSFLEEFMGGLLRTGMVTYNDILGHVIIKCDDDPSLVERTWLMLEDEADRQESSLSDALQGLNRSEKEFDINDYGPQFKHAYKKFSKTQRKAEKEIERLKKWMATCLMQNNFDGYAYASNQLIKIMSNGSVPAKSKDELKESWNLSLKKLVDAGMAVEIPNERTIESLNAPVTNHGHISGEELVDNIPANKI